MGTFRMGTSLMWASVPDVVRRAYDALEWTVHPGGGAAGRAEVYEDDGETTDYVKGRW